MSGVTVLLTVMLLLLLMLGCRIQIDYEHEHEQEQGRAVLASSYRRAPYSPDTPGPCKALRECVLPGFPD